MEMIKSIAHQVFCVADISKLSNAEVNFLCQLKEGSLPTGELGGVKKPEEVKGR